MEEKIIELIQFVKESKCIKASVKELIILKLEILRLQHIIELKNNTV